MSEWDFDGEIAKGERGNRARRTQEWLCLHGFNVVVDGQFGAATEAAVKTFQGKNGLMATGRVNKSTFTALLAPVTRVTQPIEPGNKTLGGLVVSYARQHLGVHPREVGGQNMGPWVRLYMKGNEGPEWAWCAGFVCFILQQAAKSRGVGLPIATSFGCDALAFSAKERHCLLEGKADSVPSGVTPGSLFLSRRTPRDWVHTGIVISVGPTTFDTIEGNTNDAGDREGYEVCKRVRGYDGKDFVVIN